MTLIAGSYDKFIWGYKLLANSENQTLTLTPKFSYGAHQAQIKSISVSATVAASSSSDDTIKLYDLATSTELGSVILHSSSPTTTTFFSSSATPTSTVSFPTNLLAGSNDGNVHIFDVDPFVLLKSVKVHKKSVNDITVHPSGRVALTVARDSRLAMVNLVRGKKSYCSRIEKEADIVEYFGDSGSKFFMCAGENVTVHNSEDSRLCGEFFATKRVLCAAPGENGVIFTGGEDHGITAWDTVAGKVAYNIEDAHKNRVKGIVVLSKDSNSETPYLVASASSDGVIRVWDIRAISKEKSVPLSEAVTKSRLTCLAGTSIKSLKKRQPKKAAPENNAEEKERTMLKKRRTRDAL